MTGKWLFPRHELDLWMRSAWRAPAGMLASEPPPIVGGSQDSLLEWSLRECGAGFASRGAAKSAGLDFVPLLWENFDLAMRQRAEELTGYDPLPAGQIRFAA